MKYMFTLDTTNIGRKRENEVELVSKYVSRYHAKIDAEIDQNGDAILVFKDLDSSSGSRINGQRVSSKVLQKGDQIKLGKTLLVFLGNILLFYLHKLIHLFKR